MSPSGKSSSTISFRQLWQRLVPLYDPREAQAIVRTLLAQSFGLSLTDIVTGALAGLDEAGALRLQAMMRRLGKGEPVQYVTGWAEFDGLAFAVRPGVLIPRPETAELLKWLSPECNTTSSAGNSLPVSGAQCPFRLLDIGTGSGCIAIAAALAYPRAQVMAWDISDTALSVARANAVRLHARVEFVGQDFFHPPADIDCWDVVVSNPPYVTRGEKSSMARNVVAYEPPQALFVPDDDPLCCYRAILRYACRALKPGGKVVFEINPLFADSLLQLHHDEGFCGAEIINDQFGRKRFMKSCKPEKAVDPSVRNRR